MADKGATPDSVSETAEQNFNPALDGLAEQTIGGVQLQTEVRTPHGGGRQLGRPLLTPPAPPGLLDLTDTHNTRSKDPRTQWQALFDISIRDLLTETDPGRLGNREQAVQGLAIKLQEVHDEYLTDRGLDPTQDPHATYMATFLRKFIKAKERMRAKLFTDVEQVVSGTLETQFRPHGRTYSITSGSTAATNLSHPSAILSKMTRLRKDGLSVATTMGQVLSDPEISQAVLATVQQQWEGVEARITEYEQVYDAALELMGELDPRIADLEEVNGTFHDAVRQVRTQLLQAQCTLAGKSLTRTQGTEAHNLGFVAPPRHTVARSYLPREAINPALPFRYDPNVTDEAIVNQLDNLSVQDQGHNHMATQPQPTQRQAPTLEKSHIKLPSTKPPAFSGEMLDYLPWRRHWQDTMGAGCKDPVQLVALKEALPRRTASIIGLQSIRSMDTFWQMMDEEYVDFKELARRAIEEVKALDKADSRFLQIFKNKLIMHASDLKLVKLQDRISGDNMVEESWVPMLPSEARDDWLRDNAIRRGRTLWEAFIVFLDEQAKTAREREKIKLAAKRQDTGTTIKRCTVCRATDHLARTCKAKYCAVCRVKHNPGAHTKEQPTEGWYCASCDEKHPVGQHTRQLTRRDQGQSIHLQSATTCRQCARIIRDREQTCGGCGIVGQPGQSIHCYDHCETFMVARGDERLKIINKHGHCTLCLARDHTTDSHKARLASQQKPLQECGIKTGKGGSQELCNSKQNAALHGASTHTTNHIQLHTVAHNPAKTATSTFRQATEKAASASRQQELLRARTLLDSPETPGTAVLLQVVPVPLVHGLDRLQSIIKVLFDTASTCSMITRNLLRRLKLETRFKTLTINTITNSQSIDSEVVVLELMDLKGNIHNLRAFVVNAISRVEHVHYPELLKEGFSRVDSTWPLSRPEATIDLLVGNEKLALHPTQLELVGDLGLYASNFSETKILAGHHPVLMGKSDALSEECHFLRSASPPSDQQCFKIAAYDTTLLAGEAMGEYSPKACNSCKSCTMCSFASRSMSQREKKELNYIASGIRYIADERRFQVSYPFLEDPKEALSDNRHQAIACAASLERTLTKKGLTDIFHVEFQKFIDNRSISEVLGQEMKDWTGPVHYLPMQVVLNEGSTTTPYRIVTNSSCKDPVTKKSLNDILAKGPNLLSDCGDILTRFRSKIFVLATDITKAYHSLRTGPLERHTRRVVYRKPPGLEWKTYAFDCVSFGDCPAAVILEVSIRELMSLFKSMDPEAAERFLRDRFVDDTLTGHNKLSTIQRFRGKVLDDFQTTGTFADILKMGNYILKVIVANGDPPGPMVDKLGGAVLGLPWDAPTDMIVMPLRVNISKRVRSLPTTSDLTVSTLPSLHLATLSRRICLSITMALYDPLGLLTPLTIRLKRLLQLLAISCPSRPWDEDLNPAELPAWRTILATMVETGSIPFQRATIPEDADLTIMTTLIIFVDGSDIAKAFTIYVRYVRKSGSIFVALLAAKAKLNCAGGQSTPRSELDASTLGSRALTNTLRALEGQVERVYILGDSKTILHSLKVGAVPFNEYFGNRINEIAERMEAVSIPVTWAYIPSALNAADIASRATALPEDLLPGSKWQTGPDFLSLPPQDWPIDTDIESMTDPLPSEELRKQFKFCGIPEQVLVTGIKEHTPYPLGLTDDLVAMANYSPSWPSLLHKTELLSRPFASFRLRQQLLLHREGLISALQLEHQLAELANKATLDIWFRHAGKDTILLMKSGKLSNLIIIIKDDIPYVQTRFKVKVHQYWGATELPTILASTRLGYLICLDAHDQCHKGNDMALTITKQTAYIVGAKKILSSIRKRCMICKKEGVTHSRQQMGPVPEELQHPDPPFSKLALDLCGPFLVKADVRRRSPRQAADKVKMWVVVYVCHSTSATRLYLAKDYSAEGFLQTWHQHVADCGKPSMVYSDRGSQLVSAAGGLDPSDEEDIVNWEVVGHKTGVTWSFCPAQAQWRNGKAEAIVKGVKHSLRTSFKSFSMDYFDFNTILKQIAHLLNSRPVELMLGAYSRDGGGQELDSNLPDEFHPITPNDLLIGSGGPHLGSENFAPCSGPRRLSYMEERLQAWHKAFVYTCQDRLFVVPKLWSKRTRNFQTGDVVYMLKDSLVGLSLKWGIVHEVLPDDSGVVRDAIIRYILIQSGRSTFTSVYTKPGPFKYKRVAVQNLALMYSVQDQESDKERNLSTAPPHESAPIDVLAPPLETQVSQVHSPCSNSVSVFNTAGFTARNSGQEDLSVPGRTHQHDTPLSTTLLTTGKELQDGTQGIPSVTTVHHHQALHCGHSSPLRVLSPTSNSSPPGILHDFGVPAPLHHRPHRSSLRRLLPIGTSPPPHNQHAHGLRTHLQGEEPPHSGSPRCDIHCSSHPHVPHYRLFDS